MLAAQLRGDGVISERALVDRRAGLESRDDLQSSLFDAILEVAGAKRQWPQSSTSRVGKVKPGGITPMTVKTSSSSGPPCRAHPGSPPNSVATALSLRMTCRGRAFAVFLRRRTPARAQARRRASGTGRHDERDLEPPRFRLAEPIRFAPISPMNAAIPSNDVALPLPVPDSWRATAPSSSTRGDRCQMVTRRSASANGQRPEEDEVGD